MSGKRHLGVLDHVQGNRKTWKLKKKKPSKGEQKEEKYNKTIKADISPKASFSPPLFLRCHITTALQYAPSVISSNSDSKKISTKAKKKETKERGEDWLFRKLQGD
ncbi:hypothetical protein VTH06DRAFT_8503 [Thermothelomyces fergusii]